MDQVFSPLALNRLKILKNRLAVAPMTTQQSLPDGRISQAEADWLLRLSEDGFGMVITCAASISDTATAFYRQLSLAHDSVVPELKKVSEGMKKNGSLNLIQLCHGGSRTIEKLTGEKPHSASAYTLPAPGFESPLVLSEDQIAQIVTDFANACVRAENAGWDGVELHGANGYLFTQFISTMTNTRTDAYGGSLENRARLAREVVRACREKVSENFVIGFRLSFEGMGMEKGLDIDENIRIANWLAEDGIDYVHSSQMSHKARSVKYQEVKIVNHLRKHLLSELPLVLAGGINSIEDAEEAMGSGTDIIAVGRPAIGNQKVPAYFKRREPLPCATPFNEQHLRSIGISDHFIDYVKNAPPLKSLNIVQP